MVMDFFSSLFGGRRSSTPSLRVPCNGILTDVMTDPSNSGYCGNRCPGGMHYGDRECVPG